MKTVPSLNDTEQGDLSKWNIPWEMCTYLSETLGFWIKKDLDLYASNLGQVT